ncbi:MAG: hypothetical protein EBZ45_03860, partial [Actinobacteria bacterium]|nr:hypothetical protein [Actinomycetota bacterium]
VRNESEESSSQDAKHVVYTRRPAFVAGFLYAFFDGISPMGPEFMGQAIGTTMALLKNAGTAKGEAASEEKVMGEVIARTLGQVKSWKPAPNDSSEERTFRRFSACGVMVRLAGITPPDTTPVKPSRPLGK